MILDTNALFAWAEGASGIESALRNADQLILPVIALGEFEFGIRQSRHQDRYIEWLTANLPFVEIAAVTAPISRIYSDLRLHLKKAGTPIPANDLWIAALVLHFDLPLLSNDQHFDHVPGLSRVAF